MKTMRALAALMLGMALAMPLAAAPALAASVKITVDETPITDVMIQQRAMLLQLERKGNSSGQRVQLAGDELIDDTLKLNEAKRLGINVSEAQVAEAYTNVARNMRVSSENLDRILTQNGVNPSTLRERLRASIAWSGVARSAVRARVQLSDVELEQRAAAEVTQTTSYDYILKEVLFLGSSGRTGEANRYRQSFNGCDGAVQLSLNFTDAAVVDMGRRHATQLPEAIAQELAGLNPGQITKPRTVERGVSMLAVCEKHAARDLTFLKNQVMAEVGNERLQAEADAYLQELRTKARVVRN